MSNAGPAVESRPGSERTTVSGLIEPVRTRITVAAVMQGLATAVAVVPVIAAVEVLRTLLGGGDRSHMLIWIVVAAVALVCEVLASGAASTIAHVADADLGYTLRVRLAGRMAQLPLGWFTSGSSGAAKAVVQDDISGLHHEVAHKRPELAGGAIGGAAIIVYLFVADWRLAIAVVALVFGTQVLRNRLMRKILPAYAPVAAAAGKMNAAAVELVNGITVAKVFTPAATAGRDDAVADEQWHSGFGAYTDFRRAADAYAAADEDVTGSVATLRACAKASVAAGTVALLVLALATVFLSAFHSNPVAVVAFLLLGLRLFEDTTPLFMNVIMPRLGMGSPMPDQAAAMADRIDSVLGTEVMPEPRNPVRLSQSTSRTVLFENVGFSYEAEHQVLAGLDIELRPGTMTALVGASGAGKSTIGQLLARFYDPSSGSISIDGVDLRDIGSEQLYRSVGFVFQDLAMLRASVAENIGMARPGASAAEIEAAATAAQIHDRITALPDGYDTVLGEDVELSGGERQRIAIARAILADTPILVLDEATAFADPESEASVQQALSALARDRTVLVIAHRLHTITAADQILVLDAGRIVERGTHRELLDAGGHYQRLWSVLERDPEPDSADANHTRLTEASR